MKNIVFIIFFSAVLISAAPKIRGPRSNNLNAEKGSCKAQVGSSSENTISVTVPEGCLCPKTVNKNNWLGGYSWPDSFEITQNGINLQVQRKDSDGGWGLDLAFLCNLHIQPQIYQFHVTSKIQFRYAHTVVESSMKNPDHIAQKLTFATVIPNSAFISNFTMIIDGEEFVAEVKEKEEAKELFDQAVTVGQGAGLVEQDFRDSNIFSVSVNVEGGAKVVFKLTYEELLERRLGLYDHMININPGQIVEDFKISIEINESLPLSKLSIPELKESNEIDFESTTTENVIAQVKWERGSATAHIEFTPNMEQQKEYGEQGLAGQLLVNYDVDRQGKDSDVQVIDGYFVHYFVPENLQPLSKHVIFVLDISGSMSGEKISQLKDAMFTILDDMTPKDYFDIIQFSSTCKRWYPEHHEDTSLAIQATGDNRKEAILYTNGLYAGGGTNINEALLEGLEAANEAKRSEYLPQELQSIIVFLSDGQPSSGETHGKTIQKNVVNANEALKVPIYSLGFGRNADFDLIKEISSKSGGFSRHIYEGSDAALQLEDFFAEIASPLLADIEISYVGEAVDNSSISESHQRTFFKGGEFVVTGKLNGNYGTNNGNMGSNSENHNIGSSICRANIYATGEFGVPYEKTVSISLDPSQYTPNSISPKRSEAQHFLQKLHAFLNIKQLLKIDDKESKAKALKLSLSNNFVTELTSLVVISPNQTLTKPSFDNAFDNSGNSNIGSNPNRNRGSTNSNIGSNNGNNNIGSNNGGGNVGSNNGNSNSGGPFSSTPNFWSSPNFWGSGNGNGNTGSGNGNGNTGSGNGNYNAVMNTGSSNANKGNIASCSGNITLFSKTYMRGDNLTLDTDTRDLFDFDDKVVSIHVLGTCCWELYSQVNFRGHHKIFQSKSNQNGLYKSIKDVGNMFREASSVKKLVSC